MLGKIDHIVVLMLENRSFDSMAGRLYDPQNPAPFNKVPRNQPFEGLAGKNLSNPISVGETGADHKKVPVGKAGSFITPEIDPGESFEHVFFQLYGKPLSSKTASLPQAATMDGFVTDYIHVLREKNKPVDERLYRQVMAGYTPTMLPVLSRLANEFAICDQWFCSVPSQTWTNRSFLHAASSSGWVNNTPYEKWLFGNHAETIFDRILAQNRKDLTWRVYYDKLDMVSLTLLIHFPRLSRYRKSHFSNMKQFKKDAKEGKLPSYSFIEPRFLLDANDQHPPHNVLLGENLISEVYQAVREGKRWDRTLLIVTYDEHGGCYDHVAPPKAVPPTINQKPGEKGFTFDRLGVRVCTLLISPYIEKGTVFRAKRILGGVEHDVPLDHTSIIKTITNRWGLGNLTNRDRAAVDISQVLTRKEPRKDCPVLGPIYAIETFTSELPLNDLQYGMIKGFSSYYNVPMPKLNKVSEALPFLEKLVRHMDL
ncbi:phosphoesterase [Brevibacillus laterosporus]|uniref:alkaline phosphatase family protein n=1 Tax=Brevibacillus laterosporus TaxID=1465 RepID=UPI000C764CD5|nr:alkaline phosphatase family protein [Brevibacillus laterosporus]AUM65320.1 phosphoesterase [Brevibacillus laterosporus]